jgi:hypothetical protein
MTTEPNTKYTNNHGCIYIVPPEISKIRKEKEKKLKELKQNYLKLEKTLNDSKKQYEEMKKKNNIYINENEVIIY